MKKALLKDSIKEIKNTYKRFISILLMAFLGVGFFAGIRATSPDMVDTIDNYYKEQNVYDIQVISTLGLTNEDVEALSNVENVDEIMATYETDGKLEIENKEIISKVICIGDINKPVLLEGKLPESADECVVEENFLRENNMQIGDTINLKIDNTTNDDGEEIEYLKNSNLKVVGTVQSPLYISRDRGTTSLGSGKISYYIYIAKENINAEQIYTNIYIKVKDIQNYTTGTDEYEEYIEQVKNNIEQIKEQREKARYDLLINSANQKVTDAENELETQKQDALLKIDEAQDKLDDADKQIEAGESEIQQSEAQAKKEFESAENQIDSAKAEINVNEEQLQIKEQEANAQFQELENQKQELQTSLQSVEQGLEEINSKYTQVLQALENPELSDAQKQLLMATKQNLESKKQELESNKQSLETAIARNRNWN